MTSFMYNCTCQIKVIVKQPSCNFALEELPHLLVHACLPTHSLYHNKANKAKYNIVDLGKLIEPNMNQCRKN